MLDVDEFLVSGTMDWCYSALRSIGVDHEIKFEDEHAETREHLHRVAYLYLRHVLKSPGAGDLR